MSSLALPIRTAFVCAVAFFAATAGDAVLEGISNSGILWRGHYTDGSSWDLLPMTFIASLAFIAVLSFIVRDHMRRGTSMRELRSCAVRALQPRSVGRLLPIVLMLQLLTLLGMETVEQTIVYGHPLGGTIWLGAPVVTSVVVHALFAVAFACAGVRCLKVLTETIVHVIACLFIFLDRLNARPVRCVRSSLVCRVDQLLLVARLAERGPPAPVVLR